MSYLDKIHKKPVEYKISDNVDTKSEVDEAVENDIRERFAVHDVPISYFEKNEDGKLSIKLGTQSRIAPGGGLNIPGRHVADDGTIRDGDGYICVTSDLSYLDRYSILLTSLGPAKVYDTGCAYGTIDIYVSW